MKAKVYLVGAGPGALDLLTLRAARLLAQADIVFYDALANRDVLNLATHAEKVDVGKRCGRHSAAQHFINKRLVDAAHKYQTVVRLKGGDPMIFGRAQEEIDALSAAGIECEIVPGVTAAFAAAADMGVSLTRRGKARNVVFVTPRIGASEAKSDWLKAVLAADTAVIYMGAGEAESNSSALIAQGCSASTPIALIENASSSDHRIEAGRLDELPALAARMGSGPVIIVLGEVLAETVAAASQPEQLAHTPKRKRNQKQ